MFRRKSLLLNFALNENLLEPNNSWNNALLMWFLWYTLNKIYPSNKNLVEPINTSSNPLLTRSSIVNIYEDFSLKEDSS